MKPIKLNTFKLLTHNPLVVNDIEKKKKPVSPPEPSDYLKLDIGRLDINKLK